VAITAELISELRTERQQQRAARFTVPAADAFTYRLGIQDRLHISVWNHPDLGTGQPNTTLNMQAGTLGASSPGGSIPATGTQDRLVDDDGTVYVPLAGKVQAAGLTVMEFRGALTNALKHYVHEPQVEVQVSDYRSQKVFVAGQVRSPGAVPITSVPLRITDALAQTGGALVDADLTSVRLTRNGRSVLLDLDALYYEGAQGVNFLLQNGDVIAVPDRQSQKIYVLGEVTTPRSYILRRGEVTLAEALADAGGPNATSASSAHIYLLRLDDTGKPQVFHLDARRPEALLLSEAMPVRAGDLVVVNPTAVTLVSRLVNQFFPVLSETAMIRTLRN
jgi:polysaccharide export outer membrane protein